jgi:hypothetical protein
VALSGDRTLFLFVFATDIETQSKLLDAIEDKEKVTPDP